MPVIISLLRGVNVGGHHKIKMDELRALYESLGLRDVRTFIQSGNVIFKTDERDLTALAERIEKAIEKKYGFRPAVMLRTGAELKKSLDNNPFAKRDGINRALVAFFFLAEELKKDARDAVLAAKIEPEEVFLGRRDCHVYYPNGMGRPSKSAANIAKLLQTPATVRNWNTVEKLLEMAEECDK